MSGTPPTVALFSTHFLAWSQTFVHEELKAHRRYRAEVFAAWRENSDRFDYPHVHALAPDPARPPASRLERVRRLAEARLYVTTRHSPTFDALFASRDYALCHAHFGVGAVYAMRYAERFRKPLVVTFHGYDVPLLTSPTRWHPRHVRYALYGPRMLEQLTLGLCASNELRELLIAYGVAPEKLVVWRLGIDLDAFRVPPRELAPADDVTQVIMIGRFAEKKGFVYGLRAFARQIERGARAHLTLVGAGEQEGQLREIVRARGLESHVTFTGSLSSAEVASRLRASDVLMAPSVVAHDGNRESGLIVVKEASASEVVPIGTWHGGIPEIIDDGETGFLVPERDVAVLSERLGRLIDDPALRLRMGRAARAKMEREYDVNARVAALEDHYDEARRRFAAGG